MLRSPVVLAPVLAIALCAVTGCRPLLDGGWQGTASCPNETYPVSAIFNQTNDGEVEGVVYIEGIYVLITNLIVRGEIDNGEIDPEDGNIRFDLQTDGEPLADFKCDLEYSNDELTELDGDIDQIDDNGELVQSCTLDLDRTSDPTD